MVQMATDLSKFSMYRDVCVWIDHVSPAQLSHWSSSLDTQINLSLTPAQSVQLQGKLWEKYFCFEGWWAAKLYPLCVLCLLGELWFLHKEKAGPNCALKFARTRVHTRVRACRWCSVELQFEHRVGRFLSDRSLPHPVLFTSRASTQGPLKEGILWRGREEKRVKRKNTWRVCLSYQQQTESL